MPIEPLTKEENEEMRDFALTMAMSKMKLLGSISIAILGARDQIDAYTRCMNSYIDDPELKSLKEKIEKLAWSIPDCQYQERLTQALGGPEPGAWDYGNPNDESRARMRDLGKDPEEIHSFDIPFVDPIDMYKRKKAEVENGR